MSICLFTEIKWQWATLLGWVTASVHYSVSLTALRLVQNLSNFVIGMIPCLSYAMSQNQLLFLLF